MSEVKQTAANELKKGLFIAFEGIDGSGKSTQSRLLAKRLKKEGLVCYTTMEPTAGPIGSLIHQVMTGRVKMDNKVIAALFAADRLDHLLNEVDGILAKVTAGTTVITDRYYFSSYAYHSVDLPLEWVINANEQSRLILKPTVNIFIDVEPRKALQRIAANRFHTELFEKESRLIKVREQFSTAFEHQKKVENCLFIDGNRNEAEIAADIWREVTKYFN